MGTTNENFGNKVRKLRKKMGLSQEQLAIKAHLDITSINEIENGSRNPMLKTIKKIAGALGVASKDLLD
ncbi:MAG: hypothetical protein ACD_19C00426G0117 [uncultured bacterium]|nr:MAG: hypothetical protein ACD_19C00426G0117 [uncultured bacterium]